MVPKLKRPKIGAAVYVLPNLITAGNLFWGFFSVMKSINGDFGWAATAIVIASIFDVLDGRVARFTKGTSEFGVQFDSLCDLISFGLAPAVLMYQYGLHDLGRIGWIISFLFLACGALRLARFNVQSSIGKASGDFTGLPIPLAALLISTFVAFMVDLDKTGGGNTWLFNWLFEYVKSTEIRTICMVVAGPLLALAMVSNIEYRSHKVLKITAIKPFPLLAICVFILALLAYQPEAFGFAACLFYAVSGPFEWIVGWKKAVNDDDIFMPLDDDESVMLPVEASDETEAQEKDE